MICSEHHSHLTFWLIFTNQKPFQKILKMSFLKNHKWWSVLMMRIHVLMMFWTLLMMIHKVCRKWQHDIVDSLQYQEFQDYRISASFTLEHKNVLVVDHWFGVTLSESIQYGVVGLCSVVDEESPQNESKRVVFT